MSSFTSSPTSTIGHSPIDTDSGMHAAINATTTATTDTRVFDLVVRFNLFPALELHPTWLSLLGLSESWSDEQDINTQETSYKKSVLSSCVGEVSTQVRDSCLTPSPLMGEGRGEGGKLCIAPDSLSPSLCLWAIAPCIASPTSSLKSSPTRGERTLLVASADTHADQLTDSESNASPWWVRQLSRACLQTFELDRQFDMDFSDQGKRLALLPLSVLQPLTQLVLAIMLRGELRKRIDRTSVQRLQQLLGESTWHRALQWSGIAPPMPTLAATSSLSIDLTTVEDAQWQQCELVLLLAMIPVAASGVRGRLQLKFPQATMLSALQAEARLPERLRELLRLRLLPLYVQVVTQHFADWQWVISMSLDSIPLDSTSLASPEAAMSVPLSSMTTAPQAFTGEHA